MDGFRQQFTFTTFGNVTLIAVSEVCRKFLTSEILPVIAHLTAG